MTAYTDHIKREIPRLRGSGLSAKDAMSAAAKSWREHGKQHSAAHMGAMKSAMKKGESFNAAHKKATKQVGGARASARQGNALVDQLEGLNVPTGAPKGRAKRQKKVSALEIENCTDVESCKLQIRLLLQKQAPAWLANSEGKVRTLVDLLAQEDEIARALEAGKRKLGKIDSEIMRIAKSLPI
jgi:hypothetical protein